MENAIDCYNMRQVILDFPKQFRVGLEAAKNIKIPIVSGFRFQVSGLVICGMGGSALPGELLKLLNANYLRVPLGIHIYRNYGLPYFIKIQNPKSKIQNLIVCISYSGNTEETLSAYHEAIKEKLPVVSIASGGKLAELSKKYKTPIAIIPGGIQPRSALGYQFAALIKILENAKIIKNADKRLLSLEKTLKPGSLEKQGKILAKNLARPPKFCGAKLGRVKKIPLIYASQNYKALAYFWKIKFNENSKIPAFWNYFPELNHNEMAGYDKVQNFHVMLLRDRNENPKILKRMEITADIIKSNGCNADFIDLEGKNIFEKVFSNYILGDWVSYYLALEYDVDPTPVELVEEFKKKLK